MPLDALGKETGWLSKWAFQRDSLKADSVGREAIEDAYFAATAEMRAKFADAFVNAAKIATDAVETAKIVALAVTEVKLAAPTVNGLNAGRVAKYTYDFATLGGAVSTITLTGDALPANAIVIGGFMEVLTLLAAGLNATGALQLEGANDLLAATVIAGAPWSSIGRKAIIPVFTAASAVKTSVARTPALVVGVAAVTSGKFNLFLFYTVTD